MRNGASISVFFPAFNDEATIAALVEEAEDLLSLVTDDYEIIVVNDGSTDATANVLDELSRTRPHLRVFHHESNRGYGAALRSGFRLSSKELVFYTDGDGQYDVRELATLLPLMTDETDVVNGYKINRADRADRIILGKIYNRMVRLLFRLPIRDVDCDFRLIRRSAIQDVELRSSSGGICVEMVHKLYARGCVFAEAAVHHYPRRHGSSQFFRPYHLTRTLLELIRLRVKLWTSSHPSIERNYRPDINITG